MTLCLIPEHCRHWVSQCLYSMEGEESTSSVKFYAQKKELSAPIWEGVDHSEIRRFNRENGLPLQALHLIDNAPSHPSDMNGDIKAIFLPPNMATFESRRRHCLLVLEQPDDNSEDTGSEAEGVSKDLVSHSDAANALELALC
ncbi:hypothetical protein ANN_15281 [Periplaneta americana]|uniref:DDE-1 domain-containing protein n=1 Tax=Periplaneta americana TaxID=6978 RepID=A0ABQ8SGL5_PERAM|nr:hypothetical protein ANN_15281 [Periplaneta americana]